MKGLKSILFSIFILLNFSACQDLDLNPLSEAASGNWYSSEEEMDMSIYGLFRTTFWQINDEFWADDQHIRNTLNAINNGSLNGETSFVVTKWQTAYKAIARANVLLANLDRAREMGIHEDKIKLYEAQAKFVRGAQYAYLCFYFGDVVYLDKEIDIDEAFAFGRTSKSEIMKRAYKDLDDAISVLPVSYPDNVPVTVTKGAAYAYKARYALYNGDWDIAIKAAKDCMDLNVYELHEDFASLFLQSTKRSKEMVFGFPRSVGLGFGTSSHVQNMLPRNRGGYAGVYPSWELFCSYLCTDGLPIDESPLFDPSKPFENRDPRCTATIVEFEKPHLGVIYDPNPLSTKVLNIITGKMISNKDTRAVATYASYNGLLWKKGVDESWLENAYQIEPDYVIIRYADVLLMYAEAKIEANDIDESVLNAINQVRARAYKVKVSETSLYPAVTTTDQSELRRIVRVERRMEFAREGLRYNDIIRWRIAEKVLNTPHYGLLDPAKLKNLVEQGLWFFPETPQIDEDGIADFKPLYDKGWVKKIVERSFNADRQYLWPIPTKEILINKNITQNPNY